MITIQRVYDARIADTYVKLLVELREKEAPRILKIFTDDDRQLTNVDVAVQKALIRKLDLLG